MLEIEFQTRSVYRYFGVPQIVFEALLAQDSLGAYFNAEIRDSYPSERVR